MKFRLTDVRLNPLSPQSNNEKTGCQRNKFSVGETIEIMKPDGRNISALVRGIYTEDGESQESAPHPKQKLWIDLGVELDRFDILRRKEME